MLAVDLAHVGNKEGVFRPRTTAVDIDIINAIFEDLKNQFFGRQLGPKLFIGAIVATIGILETATIVVIMFIEVYFLGRESRKCHSHAADRLGNGVAFRSKKRDLREQKLEAEKEGVQVDPGRQKRVLGRTINATTKVDWTRPPRPFLRERKNRQRSPMQLSVVLNLRKSYIEERMLT